MKKALAITIPMLCILGCLVFAEILLTAVVPVPDPHAHYRQEKAGVLNQYIRSEFPPGYRVTTEVDPGLPGMSGVNTFSTNNMGFRGGDLIVPKPSNEVRIFMVGGSTTECFYIDDAEALNAVLERFLQEQLGENLSIKVYNSGKSGDASDDHLSMLAHRIAHLEPDVVILFSGLNDLTRSIYGHDYLHYVKSKPVASSSLLPRSLRSLVHDFPSVATEFQIPRRVFYAVKRFSRSDRDVMEEIPLKTDYKGKVALRKSVPVTSEKPRVDGQAYRTNLSSIAGIAMANRIQLVLVTQQSTWNSTVDPATDAWQWMLYRNGKTYNAAVMADALESLNDIMRQVSRTYSVPLYDLARTLPKSTQYFYDDVHFNVKGAAETGKLLGQFILPLVQKKNQRSGVAS